MKTYYSQQRQQQCQQQQQLHRFSRHGWYSSSSFASISTKDTIIINDTKKQPVMDETAKPSTAPKLALPDQEIELHLANLQSNITKQYQQGDYSTALQSSKELLKQTIQQFGQDHPATASAHNNIGLMHKLLGNFVDARQHYTAALRTYAKVVGRDHASYANVLHNLGNLNRAQIHVDTTLKATERLALVEAALEYLEEAWNIRNVELGVHHPHTIATQSSIGSTLAAQVLHEYRMVEIPKPSSSTPQQQQHQHEPPPVPSHSVDSSNTATTKTTNTKKTTKYVALNPESVTSQQWKAAEEYLRNALQMAVDHPRGSRISSTNSSTSSSSTKKKKSSISKKNQTKVVKNDDQRTAEYPSYSSSSSKTYSWNTIETLSAALAGQNLAVFLKSYAMTLEEEGNHPTRDNHTTTTTGTTTTTSSSSSHTTPTTKQMLQQEAKHLYQQVLLVRSQLLPHHHPDVYATKYSLAELLEIMNGDNDDDDKTNNMEEANRLRQDILDTYYDEQQTPTTTTTTATTTSPKQQRYQDEESNADHDKKKKLVVVVEQTKTEK